MVKLYTPFRSLCLSDKDTSTATFSGLQLHERINKIGTFGNTKMTNLCERFCVSLCERAHN